MIRALKRDSEASGASGLGSSVDAGAETTHPNW